MDSLCEDTAFYLFDVLNGSHQQSTLPRVSQCFQHTVLNVIPALFLLLFSPLLLYSLHKSKNSPLVFRSPTTLKIYICIFLIVDVVAELLCFLLVTQEFSQNVGAKPLARLICLLILGSSLIFALFLHLAYKRRGLITSGVLFNYWLLLTVCGAPQFRLSIEQLFFADNLDSYNIQAMLFIFYYVAVLIQLLLSCFADIPINRSYNKKDCPEGSVSFLNQITFWWFNGMARLGNKRPLEMDDLWNLLERDQSKHLMMKFEKIRAKQLRKFKENSFRRQTTKVTLPIADGIAETEFLQLPDAESNAKDSNKNGKVSDAPSIIWPLFLTFKWPIVGAALFKIVHDLLQFVSPYLLKQLIAFTEDQSQPMWRGVGIALLMLALFIIQSMFLHQYFHAMFRLGMNVKSVLSSTVYRKAILLSNDAKRNRTIGEIVNLMSVDIQRFQDMSQFIMLFWSAPLQIILALFFLWQLLGISVIAGLVCLLAFIPLNAKLSLIMRTYQQKQMVLKDERLKLLNEMLNGIKILKLYAWESSIEEKILRIRKKELHLLKKLAYLNAATALTWSCAPFLVAVCTFATYVIIDPANNILSPQITFVALSLFNILRFPLAIFAMIGSQAIQCTVSNRRLKTFLAEEEVEPALLYAKNPDVAVFIKDATFEWEKNRNLILKQINLSIKKGSLVAVVGQIGSGKSSLLSAMLGEMHRVSGESWLGGSVAYVPQQAWIQNMTLKSNILFGNDFNCEKYQRALEVCALQSDLATLPNGDQTEIGEKGINLSGGQKQRVSLARAAYSEADIYLLDDPLSAVDVHVGAHIFDKLIGSVNGLLKEKTRVLVTHSLTFLKHCDQIVVIKGGCISQMGTYNELLSGSGEFSEFIREYLTTRNFTGDANVENDQIQQLLIALQSNDAEKAKELERQLSQRTTQSSGEDIPPSDPNSTKKEGLNQSAAEAHAKNGISCSPDKKAKSLQKTRLIEREEVYTGKVKFSVYMDYLRAIGLCVCLSFILIYIISSVLGVSCNLWLANWTDHAKEIQTNNTISTETLRRLGIYTGLGLGQAFFITFGTIVMAIGMVYAGYVLHGKMLHSILLCPISFFDVTPLGRILNRFSKDVDNLDAAIPRSLMGFIRTVFASVEILFMIMYATPQFAFAVLPLAIVYGFVLRYYVSTSRQLKRLESISRSPIYSHFQESVQGASSIRAYNSVDRFLSESQRRVDYNLVAYFPSIVANRWLAIRLEMVGNSIVFFSALFAVLFRDSDHLTAGLVGLSISYALSVTQTLNWVVRMASEVETNIVSIERIKEYTETPNEATSNTPKELHLNEAWPEQGEIFLDNLALRYRSDLEPVLKGVNAHIQPNEKIGIVGRTGAGKSSLTIALFRLTELSSGRIVIDNIDISKLGLYDLRSRLTIVPQDPVLFSGTLRFNLDPFGRYNDDQIWEALEHSHLREFVSELSNGLSHEISEGGENISLGQRQLLCLTRALLRSSRILVLDEATASVDMATDALIQETIRREFRDCTVLTIAHRLETILDCDRIIVLQQGQLQEFDSPKNLLENPKSLFSIMLREAKIGESKKKE